MIMHIKNKYYIAFYVLISYLLFSISWRSTAEELSRKDTNIIFRIQIAALPKKYSPDMINKANQLNEKILIEYDDSFKLYKYLIRSYSTFLEAKTFLDSLNHSSHKAFIVMYKGTERKNSGDIKNYLHTKGIEIDSFQNRIKRQSPVPTVMKKNAPILATKKDIQKQIVLEALANPVIFLENSIFPFKRINTYILAHIHSHYSQKNDVYDTSYIRVLIYVFIGIIIYCLLSILGLIISIYIRRIIQSFIHNKRASFEKKLQGDLISFLYTDDISLKMPALLANINTDFKRNILIDNIVQFYPNIIGESSNKLHLLFTDLGLDKYIMKNSKSILWNVKARSIHILNKMKIDFDVVNNNNSNLKTEEEISLVNLSRETPFVFLDNIKKPISDWEQMNLCDTLIRNSQTVPDFTKWLSSPNDTVVVFSLRMIRMFRQIDSINDVLLLLKHPSEDVHHQTILTLGESRTEDAIKTLAEIFKTENLKNQLAIIKSIGHLRNPLYTDFLKDLIINSEFQLKLEAAKSIIQMGSHGVSELTKIKDTTNDEIIRNIIKHALDKKNN